MLNDFRYTLRQLVRTPGFTAAIVLTLALGIGVNATMFGVVDTLLLRPPAHVQDPDRVVRLFIGKTLPTIGHVNSPVHAVPDYADLKESGAFASVGVWGGTQVTVGRGREAEELPTHFVSHDFFTTLGVTPALGRFFGPAEDRPGGPRTAVIGWTWWQQRFGGAADVLGRTLRLGSGSYEIIGVAPRGFAGVGLERIDLWLPIHVAGPELTFEQALTRDAQWVGIIARLAPGAAVERAEEQATTIVRRPGEGKQEWDRQAVATLAPLIEARGPDASAESKVAVWVAGMAAIVLLIACANVANLLLARGLRRRQEVAVRLALGVSRERLLRQFLVESLILSLLGGVAALVVVLWLGPLVRAFVLPSGVAEAPLDGRVVAFTALAVLVTGLASGIAPALRASRPDLVEALKTGARDGGGRTSRARGALVTAQVALTILLLVGAGLFVRSLENARGVDLGYAPERVLAIHANLDAARLDTARAAELNRLLLERTRLAPGVERAALARGGPGGWSFGSGLTTETGDTVKAPATGGPYVSRVSPGFFETVGLRLVSGRTFDETDHAGPGGPAIVSETLARMAWPGENALGRCLRIVGTDSCREVVGVVADLKRGVEARPMMQYYEPMDLQRAAGGQHMIYARMGGDAVRNSESVRVLLQGAAPDLPFVSVQPLQRLVDDGLASWRLGATMFTAFGVLALVTAVVGLYGVLAYMVNQRIHEMGVRLALGARPADVVRLVLRGGSVPVAIGLALGLAGALVAGRFIEPLLFQVRFPDPLTFIGAAALLAVLALGASWLPARRAARVDPMTALRED